MLDASDLADQEADTSGLLLAHQREAVRRRFRLLDDDVLEEIAEVGLYRALVARFNIEVIGERALLMDPAVRLGQHRTSRIAIFGAGRLQFLQRLEARLEPCQFVLTGTHRAGAPLVFDAGARQFRLTGGFRHARLIDRVGNGALIPLAAVNAAGLIALLLLGSRDADAAGSGLRGRTVAVPSETSTAYLLFRLWAAESVPGGVGEIVVMPFHEIMPAVRDGKVEAGLVIHEARFTYREYGLSQLADLGEFWERTTGLPIPLGAIIARRSLGAPALTGLADAIRTSVRAAWDDPEASRPYVMEHAQEMDPAVADQHIGLYVNEFTADLGEDGYAAVRGLLTRAAAEGLVPALGPDALEFP